MSVSILPSWVTATKSCSITPSSFSISRRDSNVAGIARVCAARAHRPRRRASPRRAWSGGRFGIRRRIRSTCGLEAHVEHAVRLVEDEDLDVVERDHLALDEILKPARRRDDDVRALEALRLRPDRRTAVGDADPDALRGGEGLDRVGDLERELAGRHEHERLGGLAVSGDPLDERDPESECLARSGRRLCKDVTSGERIGQNERLDTKRLDDVERRERLLDGRAHAERVERMLHVVVRLL